MLLLEEGKKRMPRHQRRSELLKAKKAGNEKNVEWIERLHNLLDVAEVETMTADELGIRIFTMSVDPTITKPALNELATAVPSLESLKTQSNYLNGML